MLAGSEFLITASYGLEYVHINLFTVYVHVDPLWLTMFIIDSGNFQWNTAVNDLIVEYKKKLSRNEKTVLALEKLDRGEHYKNIQVVIGKKFNPLFKSIESA